MYHRVAGAGPDRLARYRVPPDLFEEQMRYLRVSGFYTVDLETWRAAMERRRQLRGRPVLITFDDGYRDFAENAWPVLARHGFTATVFLVAGLLGRASSWDAGFGETAPLLSREEILDLQAEGAEFGSHTVTHAPLTALSAEGIVTEAARSREMLEEALGRRVRAMAYPYGDHDPVVRHLVGACGYDYGLTVREDLSRYYDPPLALPRREVHPGCVGEAFARLVDPIRGGRAR
jgi:peptidoglycan/xylan/chitin deacetylase (PgdA/CDA1 family)